MWSRKRRKKEAKGASGGGSVSTQGKESRSSSLPPNQLPSPRPSRSNKPTPTARPQANTSLPATPPPPPASSLSPPTTEGESGPPLANPNLKPGITVPLPPAPINPATILDSLKSSLQHETAGPAPPPLIPPHPSNSSVAVGNVPGAGSSSVAAVQQQTDHLQKVIEAQRTQLDLLSQITKSLADQQQRQPHAVNARGPPGVAGGNRPHPHSSSHSSVSSRLQTFDYANRSSSQLQNLAIQHLEQDYSVRGRWP